MFQNPSTFIQNLQQIQPPLTQLLHHFDFDRIEKNYFDSKSHLETEYFPEHKTEISQCVHALCESKTQALSTFQKKIFVHIERFLDRIKMLFYQQLETEKSWSAFFELENGITFLEDILKFIQQAVPKESDLNIQEDFSHLFVVKIFTLQPNNDVHDFLFSFFKANFKQFKKERESFDFEQLRKLSRLLSHLKLLSISEKIFADILFAEIAHKIEKKATTFETPILKDLISWKSNVIEEWLKTLLSQEKTFEQWKARFEYFFYEFFSKNLISNFFDIIIDYPDSIPAIEDLKTSLSQTNLKSHLISSLQKVFSTRLLHSGATTSDILHQYISLIRSLSIIEPSYSLSKCSAPIRLYLLSRDDTIRCIVSEFSDEDSELYGELEKEVPEKVQTDWKSWTPQEGIGQEGVDVLANLIEIYGKPELFIQEYRTMLSEKLISITDFETDKEIKILELLKLRFGETLLHNCSVMLQDMTDSKRIYNQCKEKLSENQFPFKSTVISPLFWPTLRDEKVKLPSEIQKTFEEYARAFTELKPSRSLQMNPTVGTVDLEINLGEKTLTFSVLPVLASIIVHFQEKESWSLTELCSKLEVNESFLKKKIKFWVQQGIIKEEKADQYQLCDPDEESGYITHVEDAEPEKELSPEEEERLKLCENFVVGMLKTWGALSLERVNNMLSMYVENYSFSLQDLKVFLQQKVKEDKIEFNGSTYSIKK